MVLFLPFIYWLLWEQIYLEFYTFPRLSFFLWRLFTKFQLPSYTPWLSDTLSSKIFIQKIERDASHFRPKWLKRATSSPFGCSYFVCYFRGEFCIDPEIERSKRVPGARSDFFGVNFFVGRVFFSCYVSFFFSFLVYFFRIFIYFFMFEFEVWVFVVC